MNQLINFLFSVPTYYYFLISILLYLSVFIKYSKLKSKLESENIVFNRYMLNQRNIFVNSLNHDLRIPIIAQLRALEFINKNTENVSGELKNDILEQIEDSCRCVFNLVSLLVDTYSTENNNKMLEFNTLNLAEIIISSLKETRDKADKKGIQFYYDQTAPDCLIYADEEYIKNVVSAVLLSSVINSDKNGMIIIRTEKSAGKVRMTVTCKNGWYSNINSEYSAIGDRTRMYYCKRILEAHSGCMLVNNELPGTLTLELPQNAA
jgi:K+-sensing histidine kinase KdpD